MKWVPPDDLLLAGHPNGHPPYWMFDERRREYMPDYRRYRVPGGTYFFTVNLLERRLDLLVQHIDHLREAVRATKQARPFHIDAWVVLPDHMHSVWTLPSGDDDFPNRSKSIKIRFVQKLPRTEQRSKVRVAKGKRGYGKDVSGNMSSVMKQLCQPCGLPALEPCEAWLCVGIGGRWAASAGRSFGREVAYGVNNPSRLDHL
ncbi:MAG TPA: hypothetical protein PKJ85_07530 [Nitrosomonas nitrosa]|nr:hypothetical protein [Nitrosomonas nitrosa]